MLDGLAAVPVQLLVPQALGGLRQRPGFFISFLKTKTMSQSTKGKQILPGGITPQMLQGLSDSDIRNLHFIKEVMPLPKTRAFLVMLFCESLAARADGKGCYRPIDKYHIQSFEDLYHFLLAIEPKSDQAIKFMHM